MGFTGRAIEEPKSPAAHRAWQLLSIFQQAEEGWLLLVDALAEGYSSAWNRQVAVLEDIKGKIQADLDRACFILSILTAGHAGGLIGGIASGAVRTMKDGSFKEAFNKNFVTNAASDAASQLGGSAVSYFQSHGSNPFASPGIEPSTYSATMQKNVRLLFAGFHDHLAEIVDDLESGKSPAEDGEQWYQYYRSASCIQPFPSKADVNGYDFERDASLVSGSPGEPNAISPIGMRHGKRSKIRRISLVPPLVSVQGSKSNMTVISPTCRTGTPLWLRFAKSIPRSKCGSSGAQTSDFRPSS